MFCFAGESKVKIKEDGVPFFCFDFPSYFFLFRDNFSLVKFKKRSLAKTFKKYELSAVCATAFNG